MTQAAKWLRRRRVGFTLVELAVVVVIIGVLAAFGVPRFLESVERSKASEAFGYLSAVRSAQERYQAREGSYSDDVTKLDIKYPPLKYFKYTEADPGPYISLLGTTAEDGWAMSLTRLAGSSGYKSQDDDTSDYTVVFTHLGFLPHGGDTSELDNIDVSTIPDDVNPVGGQ
jgi:prepilin-type N-terminal cleavage/methylation domain-containing protein